MGSCRRRLSCWLSVFSFARWRLAMVMRSGPDPPGPSPRADMREPQEIERLRPAQTPPLPIPSGVPPELDQPRLVRMQAQPELRQPPAKLDQEPPRIILMLKPDNKIVSETHNDDLTTRVARTPPLDPHIQDVVQVDIRQQRRYRCPLRHAFLIRRPFPVLDNPRSQPLTDQPQDPFVRDPVLQKLPQPGMIKLAEEVADVRIEHPVHRSAADPGRERVQRIMRTAPWPKPIREPPEIHLVDGVKHLDQRPLDDLVLQHGDAERPPPPVLLRNVRPPTRFRPVTSRLHPLVQIPQIRLQVLPRTRSRSPHRPLARPSGGSPRKPCPAATA